MGLTVFSKWKEAQANPDRERPMWLSSLPTALEWEIWFKGWSEQITEPIPAERFLVDAILKLQTTYITLARQLRITNNVTNTGSNVVLRYDSDGYVFGEESKSPVAFATEALAFFAKYKPQLDKSFAARPEIAILLKATEGLAIIAVRLANEIEGVKKHGYVAVNGDSKQEMDKFE